MLRFADTLSKSIHKRYPMLFRTKQCYQNVYHLLTSPIPEVQDSNKLSALFCFVPHQTAPDMYFRHAFCVYDDAIIEPLPRFDLNEDILRSIVQIRHLPMEDYFDLLLKDKIYDLGMSLLEDELHVLNSNQINLNPVDLGYVVERCATNQADALRIFNEYASGKGINRKEVNDK